MTQKRQQLSLFIADNQAESIEKTRARFNPVQATIIRSHVTLCREDELVDMKTILNNLSHLRQDYLELSLDKVKRFADGKGVLIPTNGADAAFHNLRIAILKSAINAPRIHQPHITLMHPRNSSCTDAIFQQIQEMPIPTKVVFKQIHLIEQIIGQEWQTLQTFPLNQGRPEASLTGVCSSK